MQLGEVATTKGLVLLPALRLSWEEVGGSRRFSKAVPLFFESAAAQVPCFLESHFSVSEMGEHMPKRWLKPLEGGSGTTLSVHV